MRRGTAVGLIPLLAVAWALVAAAAAGADLEPNDNIVEAEGPVTAQAYQGIIDTPQDQDWYWVQLDSQQQIAVTFDVTGECQAEYVLRPDSGTAGLITRGVTSAIFPYTTPIGGAIYYLVFQQPEDGFCEGESDPRPAYSFSITPASAFASPSPKPPVVVPPEPDDVPAQAFGPLLGGKAYSGTIETTNDREYLYFYARSNRKATLQLTAACSSGEADVSAKPVSSNQVEAPGLDAESNERQTAALDTGSRAERYVYEIGGSTGCTWQVELAPADAFPLSLDQRSAAGSCKVAKRVLARRRIHLHRAQRTLGFIHGRPARARMHHKIEARRRGVRDARHRVRVACA